MYAGRGVAVGDRGRRCHAGRARKDWPNATEGWPAGLQLAALTLRGSADPDSTSASIRGDQRHILDYFVTEVLTDLDADQRDLLVRCSVFERLSGSLCDAVLDSGSATVLDRLDRADLFVTALGEGWYRCHRLFRDVLRRELDAAGRGSSAAADPRRRLVSRPGPDRRCRRTSAFRR